MAHSNLPAFPLSKKWNVYSIWDFNPFNDLHLHSEQRVQYILALEAYQTMGVLRLSIEAFYDIDHNIHFSSVSWTWSGATRKFRIVAKLKNWMLPLDGTAEKQKSLKFLPFKVHEWINGLTVVVWLKKSNRNQAYFEVFVGVALAPPTHR